MKRIALLLSLAAGLALAAKSLVRRPFKLGAKRHPERETLVTQSGEPLTEEALLTDVGESISPERPGT